MFLRLSARLTADSPDAGCIFKIKNCLPQPKQPLRRFFFTPVNCVLFAGKSGLNFFA